MTDPHLLTERKDGNEFFKTLEAAPTIMGGYRGVRMFENGYGVSVIRNDMSYGGKAGKFELAVLHGGSEPTAKLCYATAVTSDVVGWLDSAGVSTLMERVSQLPRNERCTHRRAK